MLGGFVVYAVGLPSLVAGSLLLASWRPWRPFTKRIRPNGHMERGVDDNGASGAAIAGAYLTSHIAFHGCPSFTAMEAWEWLLVLTPLAALLGMIDSRIPRPGRHSWATATVLAVGTGWLLVPDFQASPWAWRFGLGTTVLVSFVSQRFQCERMRAFVLPLAWTIIGTSGLPLMLASANAKFGVFSSAIAAGAGTATVVWLWPRGVGLFLSAVPVVSMLYPAIFFSGYFNDYGDVPFASFFLLGIAPLPMWFGILLRRHSFVPNWLADVIGLSAVAATCAAALTLAWLSIASAWQTL